MPELPEVELYRRYVAETALNQKIVEIETFNEGRMIPSGVEAIREVSLKKQFKETSRIGKFLFLHLEGKYKLLWHFGLTGAPKYYHTTGEMPRHTRILFKFENGYALSFVCPRKFGRLELLENVEEYRKNRKLGVDAMDISEAGFIKAIKGRKPFIKPVLLQQNHFAGVGNWIADEMLFQTQIHPEVRCEALDDQQIMALFHSMRNIISTAIDHESHYQEFPNQYLVINRKKGGTCPRCENDLIRIEVGGRGTFICENCQVK